MAIFRINNIVVGFAGYSITHLPAGIVFCYKKATAICVLIKFAKREVQIMKQFNLPTVEIEMFAVEDVLTTSAPAPTEPTKPTAPETPGDDFE